MAGASETDRSSDKPAWPELPHGFSIVARDGYIQFLVGMTILARPDSHYATLATGIASPHLHPDTVVRTAAKHAGRGLLRVAAALDEVEILGQQVKPHARVLPYAEGVAANVQQLYQTGRYELRALDPRVIKSGVLPIRDQQVYQALCAGELENIHLPKVASEVAVADFLRDALGRYALNEALEGMH